MLFSSRVNLSGLVGDAHAAHHTEGVLLLEAKSQFRFRSGQSTIRSIGEFQRAFFALKTKVDMSCGSYPATDTKRGARFVARTVVFATQEDKQDYSNF
jgi:hypothetical protein